MKKKLKILALVPARGGSKGIKNKNLKKINNKSLIEITSNFIDECKIFDLKILSSDSDRILNLGKKLKFVTIKRPKKISKDHINDFQVINHVIKELKRKSLKFDYLVYLQPTAPFRKKNHFLKVLKKVIRKNLNGAWSVSKIDKKFHPMKIILNKDNYIQLYLKEGEKFISRQKLDQVFIRNGLFYIFLINELVKKKSIYLKKIYLSVTNYFNVNIDTFKDLSIARKNYFKIK